jgi:GntR family transcriptional regulator/MocR family aminotransferase
MADPAALVCSKYSYVINLLDQMADFGDYTPELSRGETNALFVQIARAIAADIRRGRLASSARLPGSRELGKRLGAHRNTVLAAYAELEQEGWIRSEPARGTFVAEVLPEQRPRRFKAPEPPRLRPLELAPLTLPEAGVVPKGALPLLAGMPDSRLMPCAELARAYRRALRRDARTLDYGSPFGDAKLVSALAELLGPTRGVVPGERELVVTRGSQMALHLAARALCRPGDVVAVEAFGYPPAWEGFRLAGAELAAVPLDRAGLKLDALEHLAKTTRLRAVYVTPHHQYPTTVTMTAPRRLALLALAERYGFLILEDDYDHEFHWAGRPVLPLASADPGRMVVYVGTLSKVLAPGIRIGYLVARREIAERVAKLRTFLDRQGDHAVERAVAELIEDGELERHAKRASRAYLQRRETLVECLQREFGESMRFELPAGGLALWVRARLSIGVERFAELAAARGVVIQSARRFAFDGRAREFLRLGFPALEPAEIRRAVRTLAAIVSHEPA